MSQTDSKGRDKAWTYGLGVQCVQWLFQDIYMGGGASWLGTGQGDHVVKLLIRDEENVSHL